MGVNSLPKTVTRQRSDCDLNPGPSAPESSTLTTRLPSHPPELVVDGKPAGECLVLSMDARTHAQTDGQPENNASGPIRCTSGGIDKEYNFFKRYGRGMSGDTARRYTSSCRQ